MTTRAVTALLASAVVCATGNEGLRLRVDADTGLMHDPSSSGSDPWAGRGLNFGRRNLDLYNSTDVETMLRLLPGTNHVRLVLDWYSLGYCATDSFSPDPSTGYFAPEWLDYIDKVVNWTTSAGVWVTITMRNNVGTNSPHGNAPAQPCEADYIYNNTLREMWKNAWRFLAKRYKGVDRVAWYEPASEPHLREAYKEIACNHSNADIMGLFREVVAAIREVDSETPVAVSSEYNACPGLASASKLDDTKIIYVINWWCSETVPYGSKSTCGAAFGGMQSPCVAGCEGYDKQHDPAITYDKAAITSLFQSAADFKQTHKVPIWIDQTGCPPLSGFDSKQFCKDSKDLISAPGTHWSWWTIRDGNKGLLQPPCNTSECEKDYGNYVVSQGVLENIKALLD